MAQVSSSPLLSQAMGHIPPQWVANNSPQPRSKVLQVTELPRLTATMPKLTFHQWLFQVVTSSDQFLKLLPGSVTSLKLEHQKPKGKEEKNHLLH